MLQHFISDLEAESDLMCGFGWEMMEMWASIIVHPMSSRCCRPTKTKMGGIWVVYGWFIDVYSSLDC
jgi:hypothetical protein